MSSYIVSAKRTAVAPMGGVLSTHSIHELATPAIRACLSQAGINASEVDEIIVGNALGAGGNPARLVALAAGLPESVAGLSIDRQCCSGLDAIGLADCMITSGHANVVLAGGAESYSLRPQRLRVSPGKGPPQPYEQPPFTPWPNRDPDMAEAADALASKLGISAQDQNDWAVNSHRKAMAAQQRLSDEISILHGLKHDSFSRNLTQAVCSRSKILCGNINSANTAVAADAAAFCILVSDSVADQLDSNMLRVVNVKTLGANPEYPGSAPVSSIKQLLNTSRITADDLICVEMMEAYAAQAIACIKLCNIDPERVNIGGGALARGHPIGASGAILAVRLFSEMAGKKGYGLAAIAAAGGLGTALLVEA